MGKPTIEELEKILKEKGTGSIYINPDGSISKVATCDSCAELSREKERLQERILGLITERREAHRAALEKAANMLDIANPKGLLRWVEVSQAIRAEASK